MKGLSCVDGDNSFGISEDNLCDGGCYWSVNFIVRHVQDPDGSIISIIIVIFARNQSSSSL